ncbi:MAG TPA: hypothetical protein VFB44_16625 [Thermoleophilaceae bacterium]|nr:hypothetical protein [Thermoleophilaceae bacterium]
MAFFLLHSRHSESECPAAYAAWRGFESPLRRSDPYTTCMGGGHELWWATEAEDETTALRQLPPFVAERTRAIRVTQAQLP